MSNKSCREVSVSLVIPHLGQNRQLLWQINKQNKRNTLLFRKAITVHTLHSSFLSLTEQTQAVYSAILKYNQHLVGSTACM